jgi:chemotaxis protein methyltransferase CheR
MELSTEDFKIIRDIIKKRSGIWLPDSKTTFLKIRLRHRLKVTNTETVKNYYYYIKYDPNGEKEIDDLIDAVTVNETYFFRDDDQLDDFSTEIVPRLLEKKGVFDPVSIWSAGCSTGEEPYTLAMLLLEHPLNIEPSRINIVCSDISGSVLQSAREGLYDEYSIRNIPPYYLLKYFEKDENGKYRIKKQAKDVVNVSRINLMDAFAAGRIRNMDCVFCRNVIIYFADNEKETCISHLYRSLKKGGYLFLGHAESLGRISSLFESIRLKRTVAYRKSE